MINDLNKEKDLDFFSSLIQLLILSIYEGKLINSEVNMSDKISSLGFKFNPFEMFW
jgi:hypothetical protein